MNHLPDRPLGYKIGLVLYCIGSFLFLLGYCIPAWHRSYEKVDRFNDGYNDDGVETIVHVSGLWLECSDEMSDCYKIAEPGEWLHGVRFCLSMAFIFICVAAICAILLNFTDKLNEKNEFQKRSFELSCFAAVAVGIIGCIVYAVIVKNGDRRNHIGWAFAVNCIGDIFILTAALIVTVSHGKPPETKTTSVTRWPYGMDTGLDSAFQQETQISGFPEIDNPAFTDPSQIRFTRTTATPSRPPSTISTARSPSEPSPADIQFMEQNRIQTNQPDPGKARRFQKKSNRDRYSNDTFDSSAGYTTDDAPPSYQSVISESSDHSYLERDLGDGQSGMSTQFRPHMISKTEVEL